MATAVEMIYNGKFWHNLYQANLEVTPVYQNATTMVFPGVDVTDKVKAEKTLLVGMGVDGARTGTVASSTYAAGDTTVILAEAILTANLMWAAVFASAHGVWPWNDGAIPLRDFGAPSQATLMAAIAYIGGQNRKLVGTPGDWLISSNLEIPANIFFEPRPGFNLIRSPGVDVAFLGPVKAGRYQWIDPSGAGKVWMGDRTTARLIQWWGAVGDGITDCSPALQAAIDSFLPYNDPNYSYGRLIDLGAGKFRILTPIDATNTRTPGTQPRDNLWFRGYGNMATRIVCDTGTGTPGECALAFDTCGSHEVKFTDVRLTSAGATNPSTVGILAAPNTTMTEAQHHCYERLYIDLEDDDAANGGLGTVGIANMGAEEPVYRDVTIYANRPVVAVGDAAYMGNISSVYQAMLATHSLGIITFPGECRLFTLGRWYPAVRLVNVNTMSFENAYISNIGTGGSNDYVFEIFGGVDSLHFHGNIEQLGSLFYVYGRLVSPRVQANFGGVANAAAPVIVQDGVGEGQIRNAEFQFNLSANATRPLFSLLHSGSPITGSQVTNAHLRNSVIRTNQAAGYVGLPQNLLKSSDTKNVQIFAADTEFKIERQTQEIYLSPVKVAEIGGITEANVCKVTLPAVLANESAGNFSIILEGELGNNGYATGAPACRSFVARQDVVTRYSDGAIYISDADGGVAGNQADVVAATGIAVSPASLSIAAIAVKATATGVASVTFAVAPTLTGTGTGENVYFHGRAKIMWKGFKAQAPRLSLN
ncbi:MAG: hypothetical protein C4567_05170 [Deltaproteobacteria bacterium]|nr:MAG: hypothetical protein C4567_05170 [Deltaproteobacteria bacterium]